MKVTVSSLGRFHAFDLARQLQKYGHLETIFSGYPSWKMSPDLRAKTRSFPWFFAPQMFISRYSSTAAMRLNSLSILTFDSWVASQLPQSDIFTFLSQYGLITLREAKRRGIKSICIRLSTHIQEQDRILREEYVIQKVAFKGIDPWIVNRELQEYEESDFIDVCSTYAYETFRAYGIPETKLFLSPLGVDLSMFHPVPKQDRVFRVLYVGTLSLRKGISYLLEATEALSVSNFELVLIGPVLDEVKSILKRYKGSYNYLGIIPQHLLYQYYSQASVFVLPSIEDGFGMVMAQAMACGLPIITTTNTGGSDLLTDGVEGFILPIRNAEAIREKILYLYCNPEIREQMSKSAIDRVKLQGGWDAYGQQAVKKYMTLLGR